MSLVFRCRIQKQLSLGFVKFLTGFLIVMLLIVMHLTIVQADISFEIGELISMEDPAISLFVEHKKEGEWTKYRTTVKATSDNFTAIGLQGEIEAIEFGASISLTGSLFGNALQKAVMQFLGLELGIKFDLKAEKTSIELTGMAVSLDRGQAVEFYYKPHYIEFTQRIKNVNKGTFSTIDQIEYGYVLYDADGVIFLDTTGQHSTTEEPMTSITILEDTVSLREKPSENSNTLLSLHKGDIGSMYGLMYSEGANWYKVAFSSERGYARGYVRSGQFKTIDFVQSGKYVYNGHHYQFFDTFFRGWKEANAFCEKLGGHLATITSAEENEFILSKIPSWKMWVYWLGATDEKKEGQWEWITGEAFDYSYWGQGEPDNYNSDEHCLELTNLGRFIDWRWNDTGSESVAGIICEWDY